MSEAARQAVTEAVVSFLEQALSKGSEECLNEGVALDCSIDLGEGCLKVMRPRKEMVDVILRDPRFQELMKTYVTSALEEIEYALADDHEIDLPEEVHVDNDKG